jgi:hypothetical protein
MHKTLLYIYTSKLDLQEDNVFQILKAAEKVRTLRVKAI